MAFRQKIIHRRHSLVTAYYFAVKVDKTVFVVRLDIKNIARVKAKGVVPVSYP